MTFDDILTQVIALLQRQGRVSYGALKRRYELDDAYLADLKDELIHAQRLAVDENNRVLVAVSPSAVASTQTPLSYTPPHLAKKILTSRSALEGERKQVTILFCDLQNSTPLAAQLGPEAMHGLLNRFFEIALTVVHTYEGTINQFLGDGFMALFGAPVAHEDHARRAVLAALELQHSLHDHHAELGAPHGVMCAFRMGLNTGLVVVGGIGDNLRMDYTAVGDTTNLAARLQQHAEPGAILVSPSTSRLVEGFVHVEAPPPIKVKGKDEPVAIYRVIGTRRVRSSLAQHGERTLSQFVGRDRELVHLQELFAQVEAGQGQVVSIVAEAGGGKSRLLYEFRQRLPHKQITYFEGRCFSYGKASAYHPIIDMLRHQCDLTDTDDPATLAAKVRQRLDDIEMDAALSAPYLLHLLGVKEGTEALDMLTPEAVKSRIFDTLRQMSLKGSQQCPLMLVIEDVHWVDQTSEDYLTSLVESLADSAILLLTTSRPEYRPPWSEQSYATHILLPHLAPQDALTVVRSVSPHADLSEPLAQRIIERAEGNAFFLEELTRTVVEQAEQQHDVSVPDTIQGVLMARIDRLPEDAKRLLQTASILGREFSPRVLAAIWERPEALQPLLLELKQLEFLEEQAGAEEPAYVFKHALTQEVAYESLLISRRQTLHKAAGQALERLYANRLEDVSYHLAYHYFKGQEAAKAVTYLTLSAKQAMQRYAHHEALMMLQEAMVHAERLPDAERDRGCLEVIICQTEALLWLGRHQEALDLLLGQQERLERYHESELIGEYGLWLGIANAFLGNWEAALQHCQSALEEGTRCGDIVIQGMAHAHISMTLFFSHSLSQSIVHGQQAVSLLEHHPERCWLGQALFFLGMAYTLAGEFQHARETAERAHAIGDSIGDRRLQANALSVHSLSAITQGEWAAGMEATQRALDLSPDALETSYLHGLMGYAYVEKGDPAAAIPMLQRALRETEQYHARQVQCGFRITLGTAYRLDGQLERAISHVWSSWEGVRGRVDSSTAR